MQPIRLIAIGLFTVALCLAYFYWAERLQTRGSGAALKEGFEDKPLLNEDDIARLSRANEPVPTDTDAVAAHQTLLRYIRNDYGKGQYFVYDFGRRFFGESVPVREDLDVRTLLDNYSSPLQRL